MQPPQVFLFEAGKSCSSEAGGPQSNVSKIHSLWAFLKGGQTSLRISKLLLPDLRGFHFFLLLHDHEEVTGEVTTLLNLGGLKSTRVVCKYYVVEAVDGLGQHNVDGRSPHNKKSSTCKSTVLPSFYRVRKNDQSLKDCV